MCRASCMWLTVDRRWALTSRPAVSTLADPVAVIVLLHRQRSCPPLA